MRQYNYGVKNFIVLCMLSIPSDAYMLSHFNHVQLFVTPWTVAHQAPLSMEFPRKMEWVAIFSSRISS